MTPNRTRSRTWASKRVAMAFVVLAATSVAADTEIHRCLLDDGTIAFQEMPCPDPVETGNDASQNENSDSSDNRSASETPAAGDDVFDFVNPFDEPANTSLSAEAMRPEPASKDRAECEKTTRDAIDVIDLEMRETAYTKEQGEEYLAELLTLTRQLRACKRL